MMLKLALVLTVSGLVEAQSVRPPGLGYLYDAERHGVRSISGVLGSARTSDPYGPVLQAAVVSSAGGYAIGLSSDRSSVVSFDLRTDSAKRLEGAEAASKVIVSPMGSSAALVSTDGRMVEIWKELTTLARLERTVPLSAGERALAVSDDGEVLLATDGVLLNGYEGQSQKQLYRAREIGTAVFLPNTRSIAFSDTLDEKVFLLRDLLQLSILANISKPGLVAGTADGSRVLITSGRMIHAIQVADGLVSEADCGCEATALEWLGGEALFRLTDGRDGPIWIVDSRSLQIAFVPKPEARNE